MAHYYTGLDVSMDQTDITIVDEKGRIIFEESVKTDPNSIDIVLTNAGFSITKIPLGSGSRSHWLVKELSKLKWNVTCIDARSISPLLALKTNKSKDRLHFVRYADDWICTASSRAILKEKVLPTVVSFLKERGLELSIEKTKITHIDEGFDFLGCNLRKYEGKLLIKPGKKGIKTFLTDIREIIFSHRGSKAETLIRILNPKIQGWANHYRHIVSKKIFSDIDRHIWRYLWQWAKRRHSNKSFPWIKDKYFTRIGQRDWIFFSKCKGKIKEEEILTLKFAAATSIKRHVKIRSEAKPYNPKYKEYFRERNSKFRKKQTDCRTVQNGR